VQAFYLLWLNVSWIAINTLGITHSLFPQPLRRSIGLDRILILDCRLAIQIPYLNLKSYAPWQLGHWWRFCLATSLYGRTVITARWIQSGERVGLLAWVSSVFQAWRVGYPYCPSSVEAPALPVVELLVV